MMPNLRWLHDITPVEGERVGGKALALAALTRLGMPVPPGFVITTEAYLAARAEPSRLEAWQPTLAAALDDLRRAAPTAARLIVRSSAPGEDQAESSAAGQLASVVCTFDPASVIAAIRTCWAALDAPAWAAYRAGSGEQAPGLDVIVQALVETDVAGVLFTQTPAGEAATLTIEAAWGMSHAITAGTVTPERWTIDRANRRVLAVDRAPGTPLRTTLDAAGQATSHPAPSVAGQPILAEHQAAELADLGLRIEGHFGSPQDIEWGIAAGQVVILQSRPITTGPLSGAADAFTSPAVDPDTIWTAGFFEERFPHAVSPLTWSYLFPLIEQTALGEPLRYIGVRHLDRLPILRLVNGRVYTNVAVFQMLYRRFPRGLLPDDARRFFPGGDTDWRMRTGEPRLHRLVWGVTRTVLTEPFWHPFNYRVWAGFVPRYRATLAALAGKLAAGPSPSELLAMLGLMRDLTGHLLRIHRWSLNYAEVFSTLLRSLVRRWTDLSPEQGLTHLVAAPDSPTRRTDDALCAIARHARAGGVSAHEVRDPAARPDWLAADMQRFLDAFGHRAFRLDLLAPRYADDPQAVWDTVAGMLAGGDVPDQSADHAAEDRLHDALREQLGPRWRSPRAAILWIVLFFARRYAVLREEQRFEWQRALHLSRQGFGHIETHLIDAGLLRTPGDIFWLRWDEIRALVAGQSLVAPPPALVQTRRRAFRQIEFAPYPPFVQGDAPYDIPTTPAGSHHLQGVPASAGQTQGTARVILAPRSLAELLERLQEGDILVTRATDPGWTPAFGRLRGLVMERGGQLSHGAIVAREYGLPAVVALGTAIAHIRDGDLLLVDGDAGTVTIRPD